MMRFNLCHSCTGHTGIPLSNFTDVATHARITVSVTYDHDTCKGMVYANSPDGETSLLWTHERGNATEKVTLTVDLEDTASFTVSETGTCTYI